MQRDYIPIFVEINHKKELWRIDVTNLSVTQLIELKEKLLSITYGNTIQALDMIIKRNIVIIIPNNMNNGSYIRKNKKEEKQKMKQKRRRRRYDKYKRQ